MLEHFKKLNISQRMMLSFALILLLGFIVSFMNLVGLDGFRDSFSAYKYEKDQTNLMLAIDKDISELHRYILIYSQTGTPAAFSQMQNFYEDLHEKADLLHHNQVAGDANAHLIERLQKSVINFGEKVNDLQASYQSREALVNKKLIKLFERSNNLLNELVKDSNRIKGRDALYAIWVIHNDIAQAEVHASQYFSTHQYGLKKEVQKKIAHAAGTLKNIHFIDGSADVENKMNVLANMLDETKVVFHQAVQADRDYLFLVNIVMAGESAELINLSETLKKESLEKQNELISITDNHLELNKHLVLYSYIVSALLAISIAVFTGRVISKSLKSITHTFGLLAQGESIDEIPGVDRKDEIGSLARAADVFHKTNLHTKQLLSESERITAELKERELDLERKNDALSNFTHVVSHDLKTPIRGIAELTSWVVEDLELAGRIPEKIKEYLERIQLRIAKMEDLIEGLLEYSKQGNVTEEKETVDPLSLMNDILELQVVPPNFKIKVTGDVSPFLSVKTPLEVSVRNILANAIKHHDRQAGKIEIKYYVKGGYCVFEIEDDGPGIKVAAQDRIFVLFQKLDLSKKTSGLGLAFTKRMVETHGGHIELESDPSIKRGAIFRIFWPMRR